MRMREFRVRRTPARMSAFFSAILLTLFVCGNAAADTQTCISPRADAVKRANNPIPKTGADDAGGSATVDREWLATFTVGASAPYNIKVTALQYREANSPANTWYTSTKTWRLKWGFRDKSTDGPVVEGTPSVIKAAQPVERGLSPYLVPPDGGCTIFLYPGNNGQLGWRTVGVVGDSLVANTFYQDNLWNAIFPQGRLQKLLNERQLRVEVAAHGYRRLANYLDDGTTAPIIQAEYYMQDEFRGLAKYWLSNKALVVALGSNDFFWYIDATSDPNVASLRTLVARDKFIKFLKEASKVGTCVVLVAPPVYALGTSRDKINALYTEALAGSLAGVNKNNLRLVNAANRSILHPEWFQTDVGDYVHLTPAGADGYAEDIVAGINSCP